MKDKNFDSFKNLKTPQELIDKALCIPSHSKKPVPFFIKYSKYFVIAASFVLVCALSFLMYYSFEKADGYIKSEDKTPDFTQSASVNNNQPTTSEPTEAQSSSDKDVEQEHKGDHNNSEDNSQTNAQTTPPANEEKPTESETDEQSKEPDPPVAPSTTPPPTDSDDPVVPQDPTYPQPPPEKPGDPSIPSAPSDPSAPGAPGDIYPTYSYVTFLIQIDAKYIEQNEPVICFVTDSSSNIVIDNTLATTVKSGDGAYAYVDVYLQNISTGYYTCHFINSYNCYLGSDRKYIS